MSDAGTQNHSFDAHVAASDSTSLHGTVTDRFRQQASLHPNQLAVTDSSRRWTYRQLDGISDGIARALVNQRGDCPEPVALLLDHDAFMIAAILGVLKAGKFFAALDPGHPPARLQSLLAASGAQVLLHDASHAGLGADLAEARLKALCVDALPDVGQCPLPTAVPDSLACIIFTSGSTGRPKAVLLDHSILICRALCITEASGLRPADRVGLATHCGLGASIPPLYGALLSGATLVTFHLATQGPERMAKWLTQERISIVQGVPTMLRRVALAPGGRPEALRFVRISGEALLPADLTILRHWLGPECQVQLAYAASEAGTIAQCILSPRIPAVWPMPVGRPSVHCLVSILDEKGLELPAGQVGQITVRGRYLNRGYWREPELSARTFTASPSDPREITYRTGDLGRFREDGVLEWHGRRDDQVKIRGQRIELGEIETALRRLDNVREAAVAVLEPRPGEKKLAAYVVLQAPGRSDIAAWRRGLRDVLPAGMVPEAFVVLDRLPTGPGGKVDRGSLPVPRPAAPRRRIATHPPQDNVEKTLTEIWQSVLNLSAIGRNESFFDLGGDSLRALAIVARIEEQFGELPPLSMFLEASTIEQQAAALCTPLVALKSTVVPLHAAGTRPPLYCVHGTGGEVFCFAALARQLGQEQPVLGLQSPGMLGEWPPATLEDFARRQVTEILARDPLGPCSLAGHCVGGLLALEIARQLAHAGKPVKLVALVDSVVPGKSTVARFSSPRKRLTDWATQRVRLIRWRLRLAAGSSPLPDPRRFGPRYRRFVDYAFKDAIRRYRIKPYAGAVAAFLADEPALWRNIDVRELLVRDYVPQARVRRIPGSHEGCLRTPHVESLAAALREILAS